MAYTGGILYVGIPAFLKPTLLMLGDSQAVTRLARLIAAHAGAELSESDCCSLIGVCRVRLVPSEQVSRLTQDERRFEWTISSSDANKFSAQLTALAELGRPGHVYLDVGQNESGFDITVSVDEYDLTRVFVD